MSNWPDDAKPGVPLNPHERRWHLISGMAVEWWGEFWIMDGPTYPNEAFAGLKYGGPLYTAEELSAASGWWPMKPHIAEPSEVQLARIKG